MAQIEVTILVEIPDEISGDRVMAESLILAEINRNWYNIPKHLYGYELSKNILKTKFKWNTPKNKK